MRSIPCEDCIILVLCRSKLTKEKGFIKCPLLKEWIDSFNDPSNNEGWDISREILKDSELNIVIGDKFCDILPVVRCYRKGKTY
jgi:hypothetical protein